MIKHWRNCFPTVLRVEGGRGLAVIWQSQAIHSPTQRLQAVYISLHHTQLLPAPSSPLQPLTALAFVWVPSMAPPGSARMQLSLLCKSFYSLCGFLLSLATAEFFLSLFPVCIPFRLPTSLVFICPRHLLNYLFCPVIFISLWNFANSCFFLQQLPFLHNCCLVDQCPSPVCSCKIKRTNKKKMENSHPMPWLLFFFIYSFPDICCLFRCIAQAVLS